MTEHGVKGRVVIVTGAGRGIGRGVALHLAKNGATVVAAEYRQHRLDDINADLDAVGEPYLGLICDVGDQASIDAMVESTMTAFGRVDAIVNNAQTFRPVTPLEDVTQADMDVLYRTGTLGTLWAMQAVFPHMKAAGYGRIVNVGSSNGIRGAAGFAPYNASKEAIRALTRTAAREWAVHGIVTNCYCPVSTKHRPAANDSEFRRAAWESMFKDHPMHRDGDAEDDVAPVVLFLCSPAAQWLNGETLMLDGGGYMTA
jgi:NAD(P)-dependent dehydrogenase (short-subunit alcohol dehydrogenase family)